MHRNFFHTASDSQVRRLLRPLVASRVFADDAETWHVHTTEPWRIQVSSRGDVAVFSVWRDHLTFLALDAFWCRERVIPEALVLLRALAFERGYSDLVSPPTPVEESAPYEAAGMRTEQVIASYQLVRSEPQFCVPVPEGVVLRDAACEDVGTVLDLDASGFTSFWRYDERHIERLTRNGRLVIAERCGVPVGYTLSNMDRSNGILARLCVTPDARRSGIGSLLVADAIRSMFEGECDRIVLSTQIENRASQELYAKAGFQDTGRRYAFLRFGQDRIEG